MKEFFTRLTWVDYLAGIAVLRGLYVGYKSGFFPELLRIASYVITVIVAFQLQDTVTQFLTLRTFLNESTASTAALLGLVLVLFFLTKIIITIILKLLKIGEGGFLARAIGALVGACRWLILLSLIFMLIDQSPLSPLKNDVHTRSVTGPKIAAVAPLLFDFLSNISPQLSVTKKPA